MSTTLVFKVFVRFLTYSEIFASENLGKSVKSLKIQLSLYLADFFRIFLQFLPYKFKICQHDNYRGYSGLKVWYRKFSLNRLGSKRETGLNLICPSVSEMIFCQPRFDSNLLHIFAPYWEFFQSQSFKGKWGLQLFCFEFGPIPSRFWDSSF